MLELSREQILAHRRRVSSLHERMPNLPQSLERTALAGLQDSMPRAALLSIHARIVDTAPDTWAQPPLTQIWGPRYSAYVVAERDAALFTLGRFPEQPGRSKAKQRSEDIANRLEAALGGQRMDCRDAARIVGVHPNALRYAAPTGRFRIYWDGARQPLIWAVEAPVVEPTEARLELARRHLSTFGPSTPESFGAWAGIHVRHAATVLQDLAPELVTVKTSIGEGLILAADEASFREGRDGDSSRLLPSGDTYYLLHGRERELLVPDPGLRDQLWTPRVWPGAVLHDGEIVGTWRRSNHLVTIARWRPIGRAAEEEIEGEASHFPLSGVGRSVNVAWV